MAVAPDHQFIAEKIGAIVGFEMDRTVNGALRKIGYEGKMTAHGFRSMASTLLNESSKWNPDAIEAALSHKVGTTTRAIYNRGTYWKERVDMMQWWSDWLDEIRTKGA